MPFGYLVSTAIAAVWTLAALAPPRRPPRLAMLGFRLGLLVTEAPAVLLVWIAASTALAFGEGDITTPAAWAVVGLAAATALALLVVLRRTLRADAVLTRAFAGTPYELRPAPAKGSLVRIMLTPLARRRRRHVEKIANLSYGDAGKRNLFDLYRSRHMTPSGAPVLIHMHGGTYTSGHKDSQSLALLYRFAAQGWVCVSANYRLRPDASFPDHLVDLKRLIAWVREHGPEYGAGTDVLVLSGSSAGAHLSSIAGLTQNDPAYQPGFEDADTSVSAVVGLNGWYDAYFGQGPESSPAGHLRPDAPPFLIVHGDLDTIVPAEAARRFEAALGAVSASPVVYAEMPGAQHAFDLLHSVRFERVVDAVEALTAPLVAGREDRVSRRRDG